MVHSVEWWFISFGFYGSFLSLGLFFAKGKRKAPMYPQKKMKSQIYN